MAWIRRVFAIHSVPPRIVALTALASFGALILAIVRGWPVWAIGFATLLPWLPLFTTATVWTYRHYHWLALFYVLAITQGGHFVEHVCQMIQIHLLGLRGPQARGVFGALDIEWVHFIWNSWVIIAVLLLLYRFRANRWLWLTAAIAGWHEIEHIVIMATYLTTGRVGTPGLLSMGGLIGMGLPLTRADLHFVYNLVETVPLEIAFISQLMRSHDEWLKRALPQLSEEVLVEMTSHLRTMRFAAGETIFRQGDVSDGFYIVTNGAVGVTRQEPSGREVEVATLTPGQYFGETGVLSDARGSASVRAKTPVELLAVDRHTFRTLVENSRATAEELAGVARRRLSSASD
ncbi:MAG: cyclic nucleotide-binding domain-containing protein [bacterium]